MAVRLSHYQLDGQIGQGGMGVVYRAVDTRLGRTVAIKLLPPEATADPDRHRRFIQEARAASTLNHPHIVTIYEVDEHEGTTFIAMELVEGTPLDKLLSAGPLPIEKALEFAAQIASALEAAHAAGIIHRDIKPGNVVITSDGRAKVLDFGLAKLVERASDEATLSAFTRPGTIVGTAAYMSPEQAEGQAVTARSDIFSFGAVLYEMIAGRRPFAGDSDIGVITAILRDQPPPLSSVRADVPAAVQAIVDRALAKDPAARYATAAAMRSDLTSALLQVTRPADAGWKRPAVLVPLALVLLVAAGFGAWQTMESRRARHARLETVPQIERLQLSGFTMEAVRLARDAERYAPDDVARARSGWLPFELETEPAGAQIEARNYKDMSGQWEPLGTSPLTDVRLPFGYYRARITKPGYKPLEVSTRMRRAPVKLTPEADPAPGMVFVPGREVVIGMAPVVRIPDYWIDQLEVTNASYKQFVDAGGYRTQKFWKHPFRDGARVVTFQEAVARFTDSTGRVGPASWELGTYPEGQADFPVGGISWFEAAAYAEFAGKSLPSIYHWYGAAGVDEPFSDILQLSNFDNKGPVKAGERPGLGPWGTLDMAGNVKEWCSNEISDNGKRYILGGGWNEPSYRFTEEDGADPWERRITYGVRLVRNLGPAEQANLAIARVARDPSTVVPVSDDEFAIYKRLYEYDRTPLESRVEKVDDTSSHYRKEKVSFKAPYGNERIPAYLFLPKNATPPYQTIVFFPSAYGRTVPSSDNLDLGTFEFLVKSGRAVLYPVYQGTFERRGNVPEGRSAARDMNIQWGKDFLRSVDYLETRPEIDMQRVGYYSLSMGAFFGPVPVALDPRIKVAVFASGGLRYGWAPEVQPANFAARVKVPVLLVNGKDDFTVSIAEQRRFLEILGTAPAHKRHSALEGGHVPQDIRGLVREVLDWFDKYLGPVR